MSKAPLVARDELRRFVAQGITDGRPHLAKAIQAHFGVSRPTAHNYLRWLIDDGTIIRIDTGRYRLRNDEIDFFHQVEGLQEDEVWTKELAPALGDLPPNLVEIWHYGCTEMINNVIDHSESESVLVRVERSALTTEVSVVDRGVGIFRKIANALGLEDDRHAVLELSKGKVTTDPENHTGEGIFFSSRAFDSFRILSGKVWFSHTQDDDEDWILGREDRPEHVDGTSVFMMMHNDSGRRLGDVFDEYATDTDEYRFDRTVVPVKLLEYGDERLVSRSQAKRLLNRFDRFRIVVLNFENVGSIGQAFADEVFRVFPSQHPEVEVIGINANEQVSRMMNRALSGRAPQRDLFTGSST